MGNKIKNPKKIKIAAIIPTRVVWNNFVSSGSLDAVLKHFDVTFIALPDVAADGYQYTCMNVPAMNKYLTLLYSMLGFLSVGRFSDRSSTFPLKYKYLFFKKLPVLLKPLVRLLTVFGVYDLILFFAKLVLGRNADIKQILLSQDPDLVMIVSGFSDAFSLETLAVCKRFKLKSFLFMANWDNVASKGVLIHLPDVMCVWGEQTKEQAVKIHGMCERRVFVLGSPQFEVYRKQKSKRGVRSEQSLTTDDHQPKILFLGTARYRDEVKILKRLDQKIETGELKKSLIIYRPHPWREPNQDAENFFEVKFKNVVLDPEIEEHYHAYLHQPTYDVKSYVQDWKHAKSLLQSVDGVIASLTTMGIEAMLCGKPVLLPVFPEASGTFSLDVLSKYEHHKCWAHFSDVILNYEEECLGRDYNALLAKTNDPNVTSRLVEEVRYVADVGDESFGSRLLHQMQIYLSTKPS